MNLANQITLVRILLIPAFVFFAVCYGGSVSSGYSAEWQRFIAISIFLVACLTDFLDGWMARVFKGESRLGAVLDPLADKGLLLSAVITLSVCGWPISLPLWFLFLVVIWDMVIVLGCALIIYFEGHIDICPSRMGKISTALQMVAVGWVMLQWPYSNILVFFAGASTTISGVNYVGRSIAHFKNPH